MLIRPEIVTKPSVYLQRDFCTNGGNARSLLPSACVHLEQRSLQDQGLYCLKPERTQCNFYISVSHCPLLIFASSSLESGNNGIHYKAREFLNLLSRKNVAVSKFAKDHMDKPDVLYAL